MIIFFFRQPLLPLSKRAIVKRVEIGCVPEISKRWQLFAAGHFRAFVREKNRRRKKKREKKKKQNREKHTHTTNGIQMLRLPSGTGSVSWPMRYVVPFRLLRAKKSEDKK